jgi:hypothetical protein
MKNSINKMEECALPAGFRFNARGRLCGIPLSMPSIPANPLDRLNDKPLYNVCGLAERPRPVVQKTRVFKFTKSVTGVTPKPRVVQPKPMSPHRDVVSPSSSASRDELHALRKNKLQKLLASLKQHVFQQTDPKLRMLSASLIAQCVKALYHYS